MRSKNNKVHTLESANTKRQLSAFLDSLPRRRKRRKMQPVIMPTTPYAATRPRYQCDQPNPPCRCPRPDDIPPYPRGPLPPPASTRSSGAASSPLFRQRPRLQVFVPGLRLLRLLQGYGPLVIVLDDVPSAHVLQEGTQDGYGGSHDGDGALGGAEYQQVDAVDCLPLR